jgi:tRNA pseudouridine55 synthase
MSESPDISTEGTTDSPQVQAEESSPRSTLHGILNLDKPPGLTSHDVVLAVRRITGQRKVGHAGTLDPLATGVLLICLGQATRLADHLMKGRKVYRATIRLGVTTDTYDAEGRILAVAPVGELSEAEIRAVLGEFTGHIEQTPPLYSALKKGGTPLYRLARRGVEVSPRPRLVEIEAIELIAWEPPDLTLLVTCAPGTYIRSLAHDIGQRLGPGGHLAALRRMASGRWRVEDALPLERLPAAFAGERWQEVLHPLDEAVAEFTAVALGDEEARLVTRGRRIRLAAPAEATWLRAYGPDGAFLALLELDRATGLWHPTKVFA